MRSALPDITGPGTDASGAHPGLVHERYVPLVYPDRGQEPDWFTVLPKDREAVLTRVAGVGVPSVYRVAWQRWRAALDGSGAVTAVVEARSRILIGHGNPVPTEVGITLHPVYGVPLLTGTALKGLLNHYLATWGRVADSGWKGVTYDEQGRPIGPPGDYHGALFGVPNLPGKDGHEQEGQSGGVVFEDAWLVPGVDDRPLALDVLAPHQGDYYREFGKKGGPNDWTDPIPVSFLTVKPGTSFLLAVSPMDAGKEGAELAMHHLLDALEDWGIGAKTRAGYGRLHRVAAADAKPVGTPPRTGSAARTSGALKALKTAVAAVVDPQERDVAPPIAQRLEAEITDALLDALTPDEHLAARDILQPILKHAGLMKRRKDRLDEIRKKVAP